MAAAALAPELLVQLDPGRFRADNLLGAEDWGEARAWRGQRDGGEAAEGLSAGGRGGISRGKRGRCVRRGRGLFNYFLDVACAGARFRCGWGLFEVELGRSLK